MNPTLREDLRRFRDQGPQLRTRLAFHLDFRRAICAGIGALLCAAFASALGSPQGQPLHAQLQVVALVVAFVALAVLATRSAAGQVGKLVSLRAGSTASTAVRLTLTAVGYLLTCLVTLGLLAVPVAHLLVGGALTGVLVGIAAQQALGNVFAGLVLLLARPLSVGSNVRVISGALGQHQGLVVGIGLTHVTLKTSEGVLNLPNAGVLAAAVGPGESQADREHPQAAEDEPSTVGHGEAAGASEAVTGVLPVATDRTRTRTRSFQTHR